jgi:xylulokinase
MVNRKYLLGVDVSTTGAKALIIDHEGHVMGSATTPLSVSTPRPLWSEQDPNDWWNGVVQSIHKVLADTGLQGGSVAAIGLTGQMHGLVLLDSDNHILRPAILWNDQRTAFECEQITKKIGFDRLLQITGNKALTGFTAPKILWVRNHEPDIYAKIAHILLPKDYVRFLMTGDFAVDKADGAGMMLFDLQNRDFSKDLLDELDIPYTWMPKTFEGPEITGRLTAQAAAETGLQSGTPVVGGGGDQAAQAVGVGAVIPGIVAITLGTSGVVFATTPGPLIESQGRLHSFCHSVPGAWHFMGVMLSAAGSLQWYRDTLSTGVTFDELLLPAAKIPPGSEGLLFLPYLSGERTPYPDPLARGAFVGLTVRHTQPHFTRAVLEGVAFGLRDSMELIREAGLGHINQVRVSGGGARSALWRQILADVMAVELVTVNTTEGAAFGAALLAGVGFGIWTNVEESCEATIRILDAISPQEKAVEQYRHLYSIYRSLYPALKPVFNAISTTIN